MSLSASDISQRACAHADDSAGCRRWARGTLLPSSVRSRPPDTGTHLVLGYSNADATDELRACWLGWMWRSMRLDTTSGAPYDVRVRGLPVRNASFPVTGVV